jgi:hypothetical protein
MNFKSWLEQKEEPIYCLWREYKDYGEIHILLSNIRHIFAANLDNFYNKRDFASWRKQSKIPNAKWVVWHRIQDAVDQGWVEQIEPKKPPKKESPFKQKRLF